MRSRFRRYLRLPLRRLTTIRAQVDDEIALHIELRIEQLIGKGLSRKEAESEARRRFGALPASRRRMFTTARRKERHMSVRESWDALRQDWRYVLRTLRLEPVFTLTIVLTLALGIGANAAMFGIIDRLLLRGPTHVVDSDRLQRVYVNTEFTPGEKATFSAIPFAMYSALKDARTVEGAAAFARNKLTVGRGEGSELVDIGLATWDFFPLVGVSAYRGRFFTKEEDLPPTGTRVAVLGYDLWRRRFGGDESVIGKTIEISGEVYAIVGVAPRGFTSVRLQPIGVWVPMSALSRCRPDWPTTWQCQWVDVIVRLKPGMTPHSAAAETNSLYKGAYTGKSESWLKATMSLLPIHYNGDGTEPTELSVSRWLMGVSSVVLLVACANVSNLLLVRAFRRRREIAVRMVLGITRLRLVGLLLTESLVLAGVGAIGGLAVANWGGQLTRVLLLPNVEWSQAAVDSRVFLFSLLVALATGLLIGLFPVLQAMASELGASLKAGTREGGGRRSPIRAALTIAQAALSVVLLVGAGLFVKSLWNVEHLDMGIEPDRVLAITAEWPRTQGTGKAGALTNDERIARRAYRSQFYDRALERVRALGSIEAATAAVGTPFSTSFGVDLRVPGRDSIPELPGGGPYIAAVRSDFFKTVGTRLLQGRDFTAADRAGSELVVIVNQTMGRMLWPNEQAIGKCLIIGADTMPCSQVVGVVEDSHRYELREKPAMQYYVPMGQEIGIGGTDLLVRPRGDLEDTIELLRKELQSLDPTILFLRIHPMRNAIDPQVRPWKLGASLFAIFGGLALLIAALGLYSVIAYLVSHRTRELGIRMALGARTAQIRGMILQEGVVLTLIGIAAGLVFALIGGRFVNDLLFDTSPRDPFVLIAVVSAMLLTALAASTLPAWRAARVDPVEALRAE
ncbi:MAG: ABC transporter permease [Gemmatimonadota bacterium]